MNKDTNTNREERSWAGKVNNLVDLAHNQFPVEYFFLLFLCSPCFTNIYKYSHFTVFDKVSEHIYMTAFGREISRNRLQAKMFQIHWIFIEKKNRQHALIINNSKSKIRYSKRRKCGLFFKQCWHTATHRRSSRFHVLCKRICMCVCPCERERERESQY